MPADKRFTHLSQVTRRSGRLEPDWDPVPDRPPVDEDYRALQVTGLQAAQLARLDPLDPITPTPRVGQADGLKAAAREVLAAAHQTLTLRIPEHDQLIRALEHLDRLSR